MHRYEKDTGRKIKILGLMKAEGGRRSLRTKCIFEKGKKVSFSPLAVMSKEWEEWFIKEHNIRLCELYYPPFSFERTGCKGCPFAINLQDELDILAMYLPAEKRQCEIIWKPVYDEYRRIGYRLKKKDAQISIFD